MNLTRRHAALLAAALGASFLSPAVAADFPDRPVRLIHPNPGGVIDTMSRVLADALKSVWSQPVVVEPKPGASEIIAIEAVTKSKPDGLTWFFGTETGLVNNSFLFRKLPYDPAGDLVPVSELFAVNYALIVHGDSPARTLADLVAIAKKDPGKLRFSSLGTGSGTHLAMEIFQRVTGTQGMTHVPYKAPAQMVQDLLGGQIDIVIGALGLATPFVPSGKMRVLAVTGNERQRALPNVPTFAESGYPGMDYRTLIGLAVARGTPADTVQKIHAAVRQVLSKPEMQEKYLDPNGYQLVVSDPAAFAQTLAARRQQTKRLFEELKIEPQ
ncbi:MAG: tripartite tricarboxylate transporter substrate binding protein [Ottowia sp.]|uniref:Bug family tripartite tricarboxylate transporter substrate binding protein n=1 Tax=Ottowia sp. TaxID=1898956 RepID=UPI0039E351F2